MGQKFFNFFSKQYIALNCIFLLHSFNLKSNFKYYWLGSLCKSQEWHDF